MATRILAGLLAIFFLTAAGNGSLNTNAGKERQQEAEKQEKEDSDQRIREIVDRMKEKQK